MESVNFAVLTAEQKAQRRELGLPEDREERSRQIVVTDLRIPGVVMEFRRAVIRAV